MIYRYHLTPKIKKNQSNRIKNLRALLKVIKRGGSMGILLPIFEDQLNSICTCDNLLACELLDKEPTCTN